MALATRPDTDQPQLWHSQDADSIVTTLATRDAGLTPAEAKERLAQYGPNVLPRAKGDGPLVLLWRQINNPLVWVLIGSAILAMAVDPVDGLKNGGVILGVVIVNAIIGFVQEYKAGKAIDALIDMVPESATVMRDGVKMSLPVAGLVPGDVVMLQSGDKVPADLRLIQLRNLQIEEAALTGESVPTQKQLSAVATDAALGDRTNMAFNGTMVTYGTGTGVVVATGSKTELGRINTLLNEAADLETPLTHALKVIGKQLTVAIVIVAVVMLAIGATREVVQNGLPVAEALRQTVIFAVALAVGAIPEGLPAIVTIALAIGVQRMAARKAVVRKLPAVETLGSTTVICSDKTGTLTRNEMTVQALWTPDGVYGVTGVGYEPVGELKRGDSGFGWDSGGCRRIDSRWTCVTTSVLIEENGQRVMVGDPTEGALVVAISQSGESTDTNVVLSEARELGAFTIGITNEETSTLAKISHQPVLVRAGKEKSVAATKTYTGQLMAFYLLAWALGAKIELDDLQHLADAASAALTVDREIAARAERYCFMRHAVVIGRGLNYANAFEWALKLMETCYIVAERFSQADLLHGPIAMLEPAFPAFVFAPPGPTWPVMGEMLARLEKTGVPSMVVSDRSNREAPKSALRIPKAMAFRGALPADVYTPIPYIIPAQLFAAHLAEVKGLNPDQPRGLSKVTQTL